MRCLRRNKTEIHYLTFESEEPIIEDGFDTGEKELVYSDPIMLEANVSPATGTALVEQFGTSIQYDKAIILDKNELGNIDENTLFIIDNDTKPDYKVKKIAVSLNNVLIALEKVDVN